MGGYFHETVFVHLSQVSNTERSYKREGSAPLKRSCFVIVDVHVTVTQLISSKMFISLSEQRLNKPTE